MLFAIVTKSPITFFFNFLNCCTFPWLLVVHHCFLNFNITFFFSSFCFLFVVVATNKKKKSINLLIFLWCTFDVFLAISSQCFLTIGNSKREVVFLTKMNSKQQVTNFSSYDKLKKKLTSSLIFLLWWAHAFNSFSNFFCFVGSLIFSCYKKLANFFLLWQTYVFNSHSMFF